MGAFWATVHRCKTQWRWLIPILIADLVGMAFGWYYYWSVGQFQPGHPDFVAVGWWPLVADSPNAVLLFFTSVLVYKLTGKRSRIFDALAFTLNVFVGLWTTFLFVAYPEVMGTYDWAGAAGCLDFDGATGCNANPILFVTHWGMVLQATVLIHDMRKDTWSMPLVGLMIAFFAVYIGVDYWGPHLHPAPFLDRAAADGGRLLHIGSTILMLVAVAAWLAVLWVRPRTVQRSAMG